MCIHSTILIYLCARSHRRFRLAPSGPDYILVGLKFSKVTSQCFALMNLGWESDSGQTQNGALPACCWLHERPELPSCFLFFAQMALVARVVVAEFWFCYSPHATLRMFSVNINAAIANCLVLYFHLWKPLLLLLELQVCHKSCVNFFCFF